MPEETLLIQSVAPRTTKDGKKTYQFIKAGGRNYSCWEFGAAGIKAGETWKVVTEQNGDFWNITKLVAQETAPSEVKKAESVVKTVEGDREAATNRRTALMQAVALAGYHINQGRDFQAGAVLVVAEEFADWLRGPGDQEVPF